MRARRRASLLRRRGSVLLGLVLLVLGLDDGLLVLHRHRVAVLRERDVGLDRQLVELLQQRFAGRVERDRDLLGLAGWDRDGLCADDDGLLLGFGALLEQGEDLVALA